MITGALLLLIGLVLGFYGTYFGLRSAIPLLPRHMGCPICGRTATRVDE